MLRAYLAGAVVEVEFTVRNGEEAVLGQGKLQDSAKDGAEQDGRESASRSHLLVDGGVVIVVCYFPPMTVLVSIPRIATCGELQRSWCGMVRAWYGMVTS